MSTLKSKKNPSSGRLEVEELLVDSNDDIDSDDDIEVVSKKDPYKLGPKKGFTETLSDEEIVLDDSDIEEVSHVPPIVPKKSNQILDENRVKSILNKVASKQIPGTTPAAQAQFPSKTTVSKTQKIKSNAQTIKSEQSTPKSVPFTPRIVLQKVGSKWQNSSTPKISKPKYMEEKLRMQQKGNNESDQSNSDEDFVPVKMKSIKSKTRKSEDSDSDEDSTETIPKLNRSTRSTRSSVNTTLSDLSEDVTLDIADDLDDEIKDELAKLEALQEILAKHNPAESEDRRRSSTMSKGRRKSQVKKKQSLSKTPKATKSEKSIETPKPKPPVPQIIDRGPIDCFDELIVETTAGFPCNYCDSKDTFKKRREMIYHMQTKHEEELNAEQKNGDLSGLFPCEICKTAFYSKHILRTHRKAHVKSAEEGCDKYYQYYLRFGQI